uniref:hypothetical protein n=1 Tax=uncultured Amaricoccus sp. TaxID=339341 RepID=UPI00260E8C0E
MSIASGADMSRDGHALVAAGGAISALDRVLAPLADLGVAVREEIAAGRQLVALDRHLRRPGPGA